MPVDNISDDFNGENVAINDTTQKEIVTVKIECVLSEVNEEEHEYYDIDYVNNSSNKIDTTITTTTTTRYDKQNTCRTCRAQNVSLQKIFKDLNDEISSTDFIIANELMYLKLNIFDDDVTELPKKICTNCVNHLSNIHAFRIECERSQEILGNYFKNNQDSIGNKQKSLNQKPSKQAKIENPDDGSSEFVFINIYENVNNLIKKANVPTPELQSSNDNIVNNSDTNACLIEDNCSNNVKTDADANEDDEDDDDDDNDNNNDSTSIITNIIDDFDERDNDTKSNNSSDTMVKAKKRKYSKRRPIQPNDYDTYCDKCGAYFKNIGACRYHRTKGKCVILNDQFICRFCNEKFRSANKLNNHLRAIHPFKGRLYSCSICNKRFKLAANHESHMKSHFTDNPFKCDVCDRVYQNENGLTDHKKYAHTISEHKCEQCLMMFNNKRRYQYHLKTHIPVKPFKCKYCDKAFIANSNLVEHERVHTGARPYLCNICGKDFRANSTLLRHLLYHTGVRPYTCSICKKSFINRPSIVQHMRSHTDAVPI